jgi:hypothetical protein
MKLFFESMILGCGELFSLAGVSWLRSGPPLGRRMRDASAAPQASLIVPNWDLGLWGHWAFG